MDSEPAEPAEPSGDPGRHLAVVMAAVLVLCMIVAAIWFRQRYFGLADATQELAGTAAPAPAPGPAPTSGPPAPGPPDGGPTPPSGPTGSQTPPTEPTARIVLSDDGTSLRADVPDITVPNGATVDVTLLTTLVCELGSADSLFEVVAGSSTLAAGETVTMATPEDAVTAKLACADLDKANTLTVISSGSGKPTEPAAATLAFDGSTLEVRPSDLRVRPASEFGITFQVTETCELGATIGPAPRVVEGDLPLRVAEHVVLAIEDQQTYRLSCTNLDRAEEFVIRGRS